MSISLVHDFGKLRHWDRIRDELWQAWNQHGQPQRVDRPWPYHTAVQNPTGQDLWASKVGDHDAILRERDYTYANSGLDHTSQIMQAFQTFRGRLMMLPAMCGYPVHTDTTPRLHLPLSTNSEAWMIWPHHQACFALEEGHVYWTDTRLPHTYFNGGEPDRINLVMAVDGALDPASMDTQELFEP